MSEVASGVGEISDCGRVSSVSHGNCLLKHNEVLGKVSEQQTHEGLLIRDISTDISIVKGRAYLRCPPCNCTD